MDSSSFEGFVLDPTACSKLSIDEKRELVYELSKWANGAPELLNSWSRQEILQILCAEIGKERKYTGLTKVKIIENLLKIVSENKLQDHGSTGQRTAKRSRKSDHPNRLPVAAINPVKNELGEPIFCKNSACRAKLSREDAFCKRCSCCICHQYDDNKDPSLWLMCSSEPPFQGESCGMSCHLECALRHDKSGIAKDEQDRGLDGSFYCISCGKVNDLLGCWRKQMITAKDTRRVDILCYRVSLSQKLLTGTKHYQKLYGIVEEAMKKLEADIGPLSGLPVKMARGIVNRLSSGPDVQRLCASAIESLDLMLSGAGFNSSLIAAHIRFEDISTSSVTVIVSREDASLGKVLGYTLWHRKADVGDYQAEPTCTLFEPNARFSLTGLTPATIYLFKVVYFDDNKKLRTYELQMQTQSDGVPKPEGMEIERSHSAAKNCRSLSNPTSMEDESNNVISCTIEKQSQKNNSMLNSVNLEEKNSPGGQKPKERSPENVSNIESLTFMRSSEASLPNTPCKLENFKDLLVRSTRTKLNKELDNGTGKEEEPKDGSSVKKISVESHRKKCAENGDKDFGYYVKVIRWLECDGHIETSFRQKFLTWYSLRATPEEVRVVKVFVDALIDDPSSLAGQLLDTFSEVVSSKRSSMVPSGFCLKLWH